MIASAIAAAIQGIPSVGLAPPLPVKGADTPEEAGGTGVPPSGACVGATVGSEESGDGAIPKSTLAVAPPSATEIRRKVCEFGPAGGSVATPGGCITATQ
jgi:hypothetical protein